MMQKRTLSISLLLASFILVFGFASVSAQTVEFQDKTVQRCTDILVNVTVDSPDDLSGLELVFEVSGDYTSASFGFDGGFGVLTNRVDQKFAGTGVDTFRVAAMRILSTDACLDAFPMTVGVLTIHTEDICDGLISVVPVTRTTYSPLGIPIIAETGLVGCDPIVALTTTILDGEIIIENIAPTITCPASLIGPDAVHWDTEIAMADVTADDLDLPFLCESLSFNVINGSPGAIALDPDGVTGHYTWNPTPADMCDNTIWVEVVDICGDADTCSFVICVYNDAPVITDLLPGTDLNTVWGLLLEGDVEADDPDGGPDPLQYELVSFDGPTYYGAGFYLNVDNGEWSWDIGAFPDYLGDFTLCISVNDGADICPPLPGTCSPENADTACYNIHVDGVEVTIEKVHDAYQGHDTYVSIYIDSMYTGETFTSGFIGGYNFLIAYDASVLDFRAAFPGELIDTEFEFFTYRYGYNGNCTNGCPSGMLRVTAMRESNDGILNTEHVEGPGELAKLQFRVSNNRLYECQYVPIRFFWMDCGDNTISDETGNWLWTGRQGWVFNFEMTFIEPAEYVIGTDTFINYYGGPLDTCYEFTTVMPDTAQGEKFFPLGAIIFRNGGVDIICADDIDDRGDINLNGISNEIADAVVFTNYFIYGLAAFTVNPEGQTAATDVNADGLVLSVADLVYLIRVIVGDALPYDKLVDPSYAEFTTNGRTVSVETASEVGAALFVFEGEVTPTLADNANHMEIKSGIADGVTRVLVFSTEANAYITSGDILNLSGNGDLVSIEAADYNGYAFDVNKVDMPSEFALNQNYPNPFNPSTTIELALPTESDYSIAIFNISGQLVHQINGHGVGYITEVWNANGMASGIYFYKVIADDFSATKKMMLLK